MWAGMYSTAKFKDFTLFINVYVYLGKMFQKHLLSNYPLV